MNHKKTLTLLFVLVLGLAQFGAAQIARPHAKRQLGYINPVTGVFEPLKSITSPEALIPATPTTGTLTFKFKITVKSPPPANSVVSCSASADVFDNTSGAIYDEEATGIATGSGSSYNCTAVIHYSWLLASPGSDQIQINITSGLEYGYQVTASNGSQTLVVPVEWRLSLQPQAPMAVPANGASTIVNVSVTL